MITVEKIRDLADHCYAETQHNREHLHTYPELSFQEHKTSEFVQWKLSEYGINFANGIAETGIVALIEGKNPTKKTIALRADMDALPIQEENKVTYKSKNNGIMHACGHDVHTACLLSAVQILELLKDEFEGTIKCIFQPGEERMPGGASLMIKDGVLENPAPTEILAQHVYSLLPAGTVGFKSGKIMASADEIKILVSGKGGHGAIPHRTVDPVLVASHLVTALQQVISRNCDPTIPTVLSFGSIQSVGGTYNVIPNAVLMKGTFRTFSEYWRYQAHEKIKSMAAQLASSMGATAETEIVVGYPFLINNEELTERCRKAAIGYLGPDHVRQVPLRLTAEDFAYYTQQIHGCFYRLGIANEKMGINSAVHSSTFDIDPSSLKTGSGLLAWLAINELDNN